MRDARAVFRQQRIDRRFDMLRQDGSEGAAGILYHFNSVSGAFTALTAPDQLASPQGLVLSKDQKILYVADYTQGLYTYDIAAKALRRLDVAPSLCVYGIDGLYRYENSLIAVQNGIRPHRVIRLSLDEAGRQVTHARVLAANLPAFDEPTLGVIIGNRFNFVANSQWNKFNDKHQLPKTGLHSPIVLRIALDSK